MDARIVLVVAVLVLFKVAFVGGKPVPSTEDVSQHNCTCGDKIVICGGDESWVPWLSCGLSCLLFLAPCIRTYKTRKQKGMEHTIFWWSLALTYFSYNLWFRYSMECRRGQSTFPILVTSVIGVVISLLLTCFGASATTDENVKFLRIHIAAGGTVLLWVGMYALPTPVSIIGWIGLGFTSLSHMFRMKATAYDKFNWLLAITSLVGCVSGFIWLKHPNLCIAREYKISSYTIGALRGWETFLWFYPWVGNALWRAEGGEGGERRRHT